ncbi:MAG: hypothetical protein GC159_21750 [Phycisphaera sp.]|nr:hypothetical protein [Phycisphaera sp.]
MTPHKSNPKSEIRNPKYTLAHVTHEAVEKIGGIGTVLEGLITSPVYQKAVGRTILVGPCATGVHADPQSRLGEHGKVLYSGVDGIDELGLGPRLHPIEWAFDVSIVYGTRTYDIPGDNRTGEAEVLLIDVFKINRDRLGVFKHRLFETLGVDSMRYESGWDFEEYVRIAEPAFYALSALVRRTELPCILFAHEFMGLPTAFKAHLDGGGQFRTIFHAHECATARALVENHPGHDTAFYNIMKQARERGLYAEQVFGDLSHMFRHALVRQAHTCDAIVAVGDDTAREIHFLDQHFDHHHIDLVYNGVPAMKVTETQKKKSRKLLGDYAETLLGHRPDVLMTHVMRPVISKALWRDMQVCHELDAKFGETGQTGVLIILTSAGGTRRPRDVQSMEKEYGWPRDHRYGYPDLVGPEVDFHHMAEAFNAGHERIQVVLVNQFGWSADCIGDRLPKKMNIADLRIGADVEFGAACYEPFGISPLEPLCAGAVCVISNVCGCAGFVAEATEGRDTDNVIIADYTQLDVPRDLDALMAMTGEERSAIEAPVSAWVADELMRRLPTNDKQRGELVKSGQKLVKKMGWDAVMRDKLLPVLERVSNGKSH